MGHYTGPKGRINRRLGFMIFENNGARKALERRETPPGMHVKRGRVSDYGRALAEKQKIKYYYGLSERQLRRLYAEASRQPGNTGEALLILCESRLDNAIRLAGFTKTRPQARQGIAHGHFQINGRKNDIPATLVRPNDLVHVKPRPEIQALYHSILSDGGSTPPIWLGVDLEHLAVRVLQRPTMDDVTLRVNIGSVIELLSR